MALFDFKISQVRDTNAYCRKTRRKLINFLTFCSYKFVQLYVKLVSGKSIGSDTTSVAVLQVKRNWECGQHSVERTNRRPHEVRLQRLRKSIRRKFKTASCLAWKGKIKFLAANPSTRSIKVDLLPSLQFFKRPRVVPQ